jgi:hypothetical protein
MTFGTETGATCDANPSRSHLEPGWMTIVRSRASFADCGQWSCVSNCTSDRTVSAHDCTASGSVGAGRRLACRTPVGGFAVKTDSIGAASSPSASAPANRRLLTSKAWSRSASLGRRANHDWLSLLTKPEATFFALAGRDSGRVSHLVLQQ